jgi:alpha-tubulin suppressor-like RCC1 family protein
VIRAVAFFGLVPACATDSGPTWIDVTCGGGHACALAEDGTVKCWGKASDGQTEPPADTKFKAISAGDTHTCGLVAEFDTIACWGSNDLGESHRDAGTFIAVSAGKGFTCAIDSEHVADCWGDKATGALDALEDYPAKEAPDLTALDAGDSHVCAITSPDNLAICWGADPVKSPKGDPDGDGKTWNSQPSELVEDGLRDVIQIGAGRTHGCALTADGHAECWGSGQDNQFDSQVGPFVRLAVGAQHNCALDEAGGASCWGDNGDDESEPPEGGGPYDRISAGDEFTCAIEREGDIVCWGNNDLDQSHPPG